MTEEINVKKRATAGFIISLIASILILINAVLVSAFIGMMGTAFAWTTIPHYMRFPLLSTILSIYSGAGILFGIIVLVGAVLIYMPGKEVAGGILVIIFSLFSIIIGGGFIIGLILGIIGGALGIAKK